MDDLDPDFAALAAEARRLEPRVVHIAPRTKDYKSVLLIETAGPTTRRAFCCRPIGGVDA